MSLRSTIAEIIDVEESGCASDPETLGDFVSMSDDTGACVRRAFGWKAFLPHPSTEPPMNADRIAAPLKG